jgi:hypothetical protein
MRRETIEIEIIYIYIYIYMIFFLSFLYADEEISASLLLLKLVSHIYFFQAIQEYDFLIIQSLSSLMFCFQQFQF